jgi:hypothetical protein
LKERLTEIKVIACYEVKMALRQPSWWFLALLLFGIGWLSIDQSKLPWITAWHLTLTPAVALTVWGSLLVPILAAWGYIRELSSGHEWFWIHLDNEHGGIFAKFLAWYALSCLALLPVFLYVATLVGWYYGFPGLILQGTVWLLLILPSFGASLALTLLLSLLTRSRFWGLIAALVVVGGLVFADLDVTNLLAMAPTTIPYSTVTGFEPSRNLLYLNRGFWLLIMILSLLLASQLIVRVQPRLPQTASRLWRIGSPSLLVSGIIFSVVVGLAYTQEYQRIFYWGGLPPDTVWISESCSGIESYEVDVTLRLKSRTIQGVVRIRTAFPEITIPYYMNPGLSWSPISAQDAGKIHLDPEQTTITILNDSESATFTMAYQGQPRLPQEFITCRSCLNSPEFHRYPFTYGWYLDRETVFLTTSGNWHPFPQCPIDKLTVTLYDPPCENGACVAQNANALNDQPHALKLEWQSVPSGPLLAAASQYLSRTVEGVTVYQPAFLFPKREQNDVIRLYATILQRLRYYGLQRDGGGNPQIAILPVLRYPRYSESGLLFVPERALLARSVTSGDIFDLFTVEQVVTAWWCSGNICPELQQVTPFEVLLPSSVMYASVSPNTWLVKSLVKYTSLRLNAPNDALFFENSSSFQSPLGNRVADNTIFLQRLDLFYRQNPTDYWKIIRHYREMYGSQGISMQDFEHLIVTVTGKPLPALPPNREIP